MAPSKSSSRLPKSRRHSDRATPNCTPPSPRHPTRREWQVIVKDTKPRRVHTNPREPPQVMASKLSHPGTHHRSHMATRSHLMDMNSQSMSTSSLLTDMSSHHMGTSNHPTTMSSQPMIMNSQPTLIMSLSATSTPLLTSGELHSQATMYLSMDMRIQAMIFLTTTQDMSPSHQSIPKSMSKSMPLSMLPSLTMDMVPTNRNMLSQSMMHMRRPCKTMDTLRQSEVTLRATECSQ